MNKKLLLIVVTLLLSCGLLLSSVLAGNLPAQGGNKNTWGTDLVEYIHEDLYNVTETESLLLTINNTIGSIDNSTGGGNTSQEMIDAVNVSQVFDIIIHWDQVRYLTNLFLDINNTIGQNYNTSQDMIDAVNNSQIYEIKINQSNILNPVVDTNTHNITGFGSAGHVCLWDGASSVNSSRLYQNGDGVGIGTTNPLVEFDVTSNSGNARSIMSAYGGTASLLLYSTNGDYASKSATQDDDVIGQIAFQGYTSTRGSGAAIKAEADAEWNTSGVAQDRPTRMTFFTVPDGSGTLEERMRIDKDGNVGIGVSIPLEELTVSGALNITGEASGSITCQEYHPTTGNCVKGFNATCMLEYSPDGTLAVSKCN
jgi:hypothetical protein